MVEVEVACTTAAASEGGGRAETAAAKAGVEGAPSATHPHLPDTIPLNSFDLHEVYYHPSAMTPSTSKPSDSED